MYENYLFTFFVLLCAVVMIPTYTQLDHLWSILGMTGKKIKGTITMSHNFVSLSKRTLLSVCTVYTVQYIRAGNSLIGFPSESLVFCEKMSE